MSLRILSFLPLISVFASCAGVTFYSDPALKQRTGLKYYIAKPYLLLTRTGNKDNPVKLEWIQLPDLKNPNFAVYRSGWGSHEFSLKVTNGILSEYGQKADSKGPETLKAIGELATGVGGGFSSFATGLNTLRGPRTESAEIDLAVGSINQAVGSLRAVAGALVVKFPQREQAAQRLIKDLELIRDAIAGGDLQQKSKLTAIQKRIDEAKIVTAEGIENAAAINDLFSSAKSHLDTAIAALGKAVPAPASPPDFELYEFTSDESGDHLIRVPISRTLRTVIERYGASGK